MFKNLLCKNNRIILNYLNQNKKQLRCIYFRRNIVLSSASATSAEIDIQFDNIPVERIRNFSIIAHVDHGKSTLADRLLEITGAISKNSGKTQVLDSLEVEQQRGITVKAQTASLIYHYDNKPYLLNLIDTPGHVDFCNEVSRSLAACNGVILLVDANHGVQAQTVANYHLAMSKNLHVLPVLNKIDLKNADPERVCEELYTLFKIPKEIILKISAKFGTGTEQLLENIVKYFPCPNVNRTNLFRGLLFDSWYDRYRGALNLILVNDGEITIGQEIVSYHTKKTYEIKTLSVMCPTEVNVKRLVAGQVGLIGCNMRNSSESLIGDTFFLKNQTVKPLPGFKPLQPMVYAGIFPTDQTLHVSLRSAIDKLILNDSVVTIAKDSSPALGQGWRLGFLGLLHMEVFCQRLQQEHDAEPIITAPSVTYKIKLKPTKKITENVNDILFISNPVFLPDPQQIDEFYEPFVLGTIITPSEYVGSIISMCVDHRGVQLSSSNIDDRRILMTYSLPLSEIVIDFHDKLKSVSSGYASFDYENSGYHITNIVKLTILLNGKLIDELSRIVHVSKVNRFARDMVLRLKDQIPRQMVQIAIQACIGGKVLARETITAYRKDVTSKLYGGDVTRRMKLLKQQSEGKKKMRSIATIRVPHETFINILKR